MRRYTILAVVSYFALVADFATGCVAPALPIMEYQILPPLPYPELTKLVSVRACISPPLQDNADHDSKVSVLMFGLSNIFWVPLNNIFGRRPICKF
jgi:hypothetical protein